MITFKRIPHDKPLTAYDVYLDGERIGSVWQQQEFSYRGTEGWNRGIRMRDYRPIRWAWGKSIGGYKQLSAYTRDEAVQNLKTEATR